MTPEVRRFKAFLRANPLYAENLQAIGGVLYAAAERFNLPRQAETVDFIGDMLCLDTCRDKAIAGRYRDLLDQGGNAPDAEERQLLEKLFVRIAQARDQLDDASGLAARFAIKTAQAGAQGYTDKNRQALLAIIAADHLETIAAITQEAATVAMLDPDCASDCHYRQTLRDCGLPEESQPPIQRYNDLVGIMTAQVAATIGETIAAQYQRQSVDAAPVAFSKPPLYE